MTERFDIVPVDRKARDKDGIEQVLRFDLRWT